MEQIFYDYYQLEERINSVIVAYYKPDNEKLFRKVVLHSSVIDLGGKRKILYHIPGFSKNIINDIGTLGSIRNAFAHVWPSPRIDVRMGKDGSPKVNPYLTMEVMNGAGKFTTKVREAHQKDFMILSVKVWKYIDEFIKEMNESSSENHKKASN